MTRGGRRAHSRSSVDSRPVVPAASAASQTAMRPSDPISLDLHIAGVTSPHPFRRRSSSNGSGKRRSCSSSSNRRSGAGDGASSPSDGFVCTLIWGHYGQPSPAPHASRSGCLRAATTAQSTTLWARSRECWPGGMRRVATLARLHANSAMFDCVQLVRLTCAHNSYRNHQHTDTHATRIAHPRSRALSAVRRRRHSATAAAPAAPSWLCLPHRDVQTRGNIMIPIRQRRGRHYARRWGGMMRDVS
jgi:hypothetical protein